MRCIVMRIIYRNCMGNRIYLGHLASFLRFSGIFSVIIRVIDGFKAIIGVISGFISNIIGGRGPESAAVVICNYIESLVLSPITIKLPILTQYITVNNLYIIACVTTRILRMILA